MNGKLFLILGPSGVGKGTIIQRLQKELKDFIYPLSCTTRPKRPDEIDGKMYYFISKKNFLEKKENGEFLENACVHGQAYYGILKKPVLENLKAGKNLIREVDIQGLFQIKKNLPKEKIVTIFLRPPSLDFLQKNILKRGPIADKELNSRIQSAEKELAKSTECDYIITAKEDDLETEIKEIKKVILKNIN